jgi:hypothetical protein
MASTRRYRKHVSSVSAAPRAALRALERRLNDTTARAETQELVAWWWSRFRTLYGREPAATLWDRKRQDDEAFAGAPSSMTVRGAFGNWKAAVNQLSAGDPAPDPLVREKLAVGPKPEDGELRALLDAFMTEWRDARSPEKDEFVQWLSSLRPSDLPAGVQHAPMSFAPFERVFGGWQGCLKATGRPLERRHESGPRPSDDPQADTPSDDELLRLVPMFAEWQAGPLTYSDFAHWLKHPRARLGTKLPVRLPGSYDIYRTRFGGFDRVLARVGLEDRVAPSTAARAADWDAAEVRWLPDNTPRDWSAWKRDNYWIDAATKARRQRITRREYLRLRQRWADLANQRGRPAPDAPHAAVIAERAGGWLRASEASVARTRPGKVD